MRRIISNKNRISGLILIMFLLALWELLSRLNIVNKIFFPAFSVIFKKFCQMLVMADSWRNIVSTVYRFFWGYFFALILGIPIGILMGKIRRIFDLFEPIVELLRPIPSAAIIPIAILFLGIDDLMKIFVIAYACLWPILINSLDGVRNIDPVLIETGKTFKLAKSRFFLKIVLPAASPQIVTGMRVSLSIALILAITVEMIAGNNGIGFFILDSERSFHFPEMYAGIILIGIIGYFLNFIFLKFSKRIMCWHEGFTATKL